MKKLRLRYVALVVLPVMALASLFVLLPTFAAHPGKSTGHPTSVFAVEHIVGKPGISSSLPASQFTCAGASKGNLLINVSEKVINDADSGQAGDYWALDAFTRTIKVWNVGGDDSYCAVLSYHGTIAAIAGQQSPGSVGGNGGILTGDEIGTITGSAQILLTSAPLNIVDPANWPLSGKVSKGSVVDYQCDSSGNCPGYVDWVAQYFDENAPGYSLSEPNWGWTYVGKDCCAPDAGKADGVWVNASTGNSGDILDVD